MTSPVLRPDIIEAFHCTGESKAMSGGEGRSLRVGRCVFKPVQNPERYNWACELLLRVSQNGFRIPEPCQAEDGSFEFQGWGASIYEPGEHVQGRWNEKLEILRLFHVKLRELDKTPMPPSDDYWSMAHEIAWQIDPMPTGVPLEIASSIEEIFSHYQPLTRGELIIHSDFGGNVLFHDTLDPCVIDFSPAYGSTEFAEAITIADAIAWEDAPMEIVNLLPFDNHFIQNLLRAINFRLIVSALFSPMDVNHFKEEYAAFKSIIDMACSFSS